MTDHKYWKIGIALHKDSVGGDLPEKNAPEDEMAIDKEDQRQKTLLKVEKLIADESLSQFTAERMADCLAVLNLDSAHFKPFAEILSPRILGERIQASRAMIRGLAESRMYTI